jgi:hypothetical protein
MRIVTLALLLLVSSDLLAAADGVSAPEASFSAWDAPARIEHWLAELPPWLKLGGEIRGRLDNYFGLNGTPDWDDTYYLHRFRFNARVSAAEWLRVVAQFQDSRQAGYDRTPVPYSVAQPLDLRLGYLELGSEATEAPFALRVGRQPLVFGDMRLVSTSNWGNVGPAFDAVRVSLRRSRVRLDGFSSYVVVPCAGFDRPRRDKMLSGLYTSFDFLAKAVTVDAYYFWKRIRRSADLHTFGVRSAGPLPYGLDYNVEMALQRGRVTGQIAAAWAGHWELGRKLNGVGGSPRLAIEYNYATGDKAAGDGRYQSFDSLYPTNIYGTAADFGWRNRHEPAISFEWHLDRKTRLKTVYHWFWVAERRDALYTFSGAVFAFNPNAANSRVGSEIDVRWIRQAGKHLQFWAGYAHLFPGPYLRQAGRGAIDYPYAMWTFSF